LIKTRRSAIVTQFLADAFPSKLLPASTSAAGALQRAQTAFFIDTLISKVVPNYFAGIRAQNDEERTEAADKVVAAVLKEVEPLLKDAAPFFGGSSTITLAEVNTGSFILRILSAGTHDIGSASLNAKLEAQTPAFWKWANAVITNEHVTAGIWDEKKVNERTKKRFAKKL